ncbi:MAG: hypothetical protein K0Q55_3824 [Verrucomicrobia bacterium]|nr:hypothetical protein [Verrucomicrobiota bacterium]
MLALSLFQPETRNRKPETFLIHRKKILTRLHKLYLPPQL